MRLSWTRSRVGNFFAVAALGAATANCASSPAGPADVAVGYFAALAARDGQKVCDLSTSERRAQFVALAAPYLARQPPTCAAAVVRSEQSLGPSVLAPLRHAKVRVRGRVGNTVQVQREGGQAVLNLERVGSTWLVASSSGGPN